MNYKPVPLFASFSGSNEPNITAWRQSRGFIMSVPHAQSVAFTKDCLRNYAHLGFSFPVLGDRHAFYEIVGL